MTVTITITDPTATEASALRAYLTAMHGGTAAAPVATGDKGPEIIVPDGGFPEIFMDIPTAEDPDDPKHLRVDHIVTAEDAGAPDFDSAGLPWDERIHASSRATVADGTWRKKRGVSDELVAEVEAELTAAPAQEQTAAEVPNAPEQDQEVPEAPVGESESAVTAAPVPEVPASATDAPPPPPAPTANPFLAVMSRIGKSKLDKAKKDELLTAAGALDEKGAPSILVLNKRPELIDGFIALLDSEGV